MSEVFEGHVLFHPMQMLSYGRDYGESLEERERLGRECYSATADKHYCPIIPAEFLSGSSAASPENIVRQGVRDACMYSSLAEERRSEWFLYLKLLFEACIAPDEESAYPVKPLT